MSRQFSAVPMAAVDDPQVTDGMLRMLNVLGAYANKDGWCWPKLELLAKRRRMEKPQVSKILSKLREAGYLEVHYEIREGRRRCVFRVLFDRPVSTAAAIDEAEYESGLEGEPVARPVSLEETQQPRSVSSEETQQSPRVSSLRETVRFLPEGNGPLMNSPEEQTKRRQLAGASSASEVVETWNAMAVQAQLPKARLTPKRARVIAARLRESGWFADFRAACEAVGASPFHRGANDRAWMATLDFLLQAGKATELAERASVAAPSGSAPPRGDSTAVHVSGQRLDAARLWQLCVDGGLTAPMQTRDMLEARVQELHAQGLVGDPNGFLALVLHVQPWALAEITFGKAREERLILAMASWRPARQGAA